MSPEAPRDFAALRSRIIERHDALPKRLAAVAAYALRHPDEIAFGTAASIAAKADVQPSTLVRFSQALGYQGFTDLQAVFRARLRDRAPSYEERLKALSARGQSKSAILLEAFCGAAERSTKALRGAVDPQALEAAVDLLAAARTIYLIGLRRSFPVAAYLSYAFGKLGIDSVLVDAVGGLEAETAGRARAGDAVLAVSFAPYASATVSLAAAAADRGAEVVAITDSPFSPLAQAARIAFEVTEGDVEGFRSVAATFALAMTLSVAVAERRRDPPA